MTVRQMLVNFIKDEEGLTMVEYAIAGAMIAATVAAAFTGLGDAIEDKIDELTTFIDGTAV